MPPRVGPPRFRSRPRAASIDGIHVRQPDDDIEVGVAVELEVAKLADRDEETASEVLRAAGVAGGGTGAADVFGGLAAALDGVLVALGSAGAGATTTTFAFRLGGGRHDGLHGRPRIDVGRWARMDRKGGGG